ncbi:MULTISPECIES: hypothetical protein [Halobacterium]|uniref:hypothetical protein n=1 Tax=Halobacterium TaxID=2239 RepID=UPI000ADCE0EE|nr:MULTISPECIES: hypothetical protein [Halobacterium]MCG1003967.1 hypothetical protein [Halobacterium noricense]
MERNRVVTLVAVLACLVGVVGYVALGWRFGDGTTNPVAFGIAVLAVGVAVVSTLRDRL